MRKTKPRNAFTDINNLGTLNMIPTSITGQIESEVEFDTQIEKSSVVRVELMEPKNYIRNNVIVRNP